jgi:hypothetical protein
MNLYLNLLWVIATPYFPPTLYQNYPSIIRRIDSWKVPNTKKIVLGKTEQGRDIFAYEVRGRQKRFCHLIVSGLHPIEQSTSTIILGLFWELKNGYKPKCSILIVPVLNVDAKRYVRRRRNMRGVDLNRDYGQGKRSFTQKETQALRRWLIRHHPMTVLDIHQCGNSIHLPRKYIPPDGKRRARQLLKLLPYKSMVRTYVRNSSMLVDYTSYAFDAYSYVLEMGSCRRNLIWKRKRQKKFVGRTATAILLWQDQFHRQ